MPPRLQTLLQPVSFQSVEGFRLKAWYAAQKNGSTVILLHGYGGDRRHVLREAEFLMSHGYGVFLFDARAHGESEGAQINYGLTEADDVSKAIDWLLARPEVNPGKLAGFGISNGGVSLVHHAAVDVRLAALLVHGMPSSLYDLAEDESGFARIWLARLKMWAITKFGPGNAYDSDGKKAVEKISRPVLVISGAHDRLVPEHRTESLWQKAREPKQRLILPHSGHSDLADSDRALYESRILNFLKEFA